jgi:hypothetical protein
MKLLMCVMDNIEDHEAYDRREEAPHRREASNVEQRRDNERNAHDKSEDIDPLDA